MEEIELFIENLGQTLTINSKIRRKDVKRVVKFLGTLTFKQTMTLAKALEWYMEDINKLNSVPDDNLTYCNYCDCMTKTIKTANTPVCGNCKEIRR